MTARTLTFTNPETGVYQVPVTVPAARYCYGHGGLHSGPDGLCMECQRRAALARVTDLERQACALADAAHCPACHRHDCPQTRGECPEMMR